jgi:hypothetical protein
VLEHLPILPIHASIDIGEVALILHRQLTSPKRESICAGVAGAGTQARSIALPETVEVFPELRHGPGRQAPPIQIEHLGILDFDFMLTVTLAPIRSVAPRTFV